MSRAEDAYRQTMDWRNEERRVLYNVFGLIEEPELVAHGFALADGVKMDKLEAARVARTMKGAWSW